MAARSGGPIGPQTTETIDREDWYARDLSRYVAEATAFDEVDLTETTSSGGAVFTDCSFRGVQFNVSSHAGAAFANCLFTRCVFFGATFTDCKFVGSRFDRCTFDQLTVRGGDWSFTGLGRADLRQSDFEGVRMRESDLSGARCEGTRLAGVDLSGAWMAKANFDKADLRGSDLSALDPLTVSLRNAVIDRQHAIILAIAMGLDVRAD